jgi:LuxR family maltose regulon positive regulatory protein
MSTPILTTKLYIPPLQPQCVRRPRLIDWLNKGLPKQSDSFARKLTLISAPAGFGKTTLVCEWLADCERFEPPVRAAWLSLDVVSKQFTTESTENYFSEMESSCALCLCGYTT